VQLNEDPEVLGLHWELEWVTEYLPPTHYIVECEDMHHLPQSHICLHPNSGCGILLY